MANWNILGAGAIGHFFADKLLKSGQHAAFILRPDQLRSTYQFNHENTEGHITSNMLMAQPRLTAKCDFLLITLKAHQVLPALIKLKEQIDKHCTFVLMHNGMGVAEQLEKMFPMNAILIGTTANGALKTNVNGQITSKHTGKGQTWIGAFNNKAKRYSDVPAQLYALEECQWSNNIREKLWLKLIINCAINPLTAVLQCKNGELAAEKNYALVKSLIAEIAIISQKARLPWSEEQLQQYVDDVFTRTAANYSSMHQDIAHQRPTEIEFITGYMLRVATNYQVDAPENKKLYDAIKQREFLFIK